MEINHSNVKDVAGNIVSALLIAMQIGALPINGKGRRIIWEEFVINELKYFIDNDNPETGVLKNTELDTIT